MNQDQIIFEKLTVEEQEKVRGGDLILNTQNTIFPNAKCLF